MLLNKEAILAAQDLKHEDVEVPEWGGTVRVRMMTGAERDTFASALVQEDGKVKLSTYRQNLVATVLVDEGGAPMFTGADVALLAGKSAAALDRVYAVAEKLNGMGGSAVDDAEKN